MNYFAFLSLFSSVLAFYLGTYVLHKNSQEPLNRLFFLLTIFITLSAFSEYGFRFAYTHETAFFWMQVFSIWPIPIATLLHFALRFTRSTSWFAKKSGLLVIYGSALLLFLVQIFPGIIWTDIKLEYWGWAQVFDPNSIGNLLLSAWVFFSFIGLIYLFHCLYARSEDPRRRSQAKYLLYSILFPTAGSVFTDLVLPFFNVNFPPLMIIGYIITSTLIASAIVKFGLFTLSPAEIAEQVMSKMSEAVFIVSTSEIIEAANKTALIISGYEKESLFGQSIKKIFQNKSLDCIGTARGGSTDLLKPDVIQHVEMELNKKNGISTPVTISKSQLVDRNGHLQGFVYLVTDLAARRQAEENSQELRKVQQLVKMNTEILTWAAHEIKTPLVPVKGWAELLYNAKKAGKDLNQTFALEDLQALFRNTERLEDLINNILEAGIIQKGNIKLNKTNVALVDLFKEARNSVQSYAKEKNIQIIIPDIPTSLIIDRSRLLQVFINLFSNAVKYSRPDSHITIKFCEKEWKNQKGAEIQVVDYGFGFTLEESSHAFKPFVRAYTQQDEKKFIPGVGLGLYICKHIVEQHDGEITLHSGGVGKGTTVTITLPLAN